MVVSMPSTHDSAVEPRRLDAESAAWIARVRKGAPEYDAAIEDLHALLLKAARFEVARRRAALGQLRDSDHEDLAQQSADDALMAVLGKLGDFRGESRFTTWAYKFALLEAAVKVRRRAWVGREVQLESDAWATLAERTQTPHDDAETRELIEALKDAIGSELTPHQREVLVAVTLNDVPIDVLAERLNSTRGALYKTLHDARRKLRAALAKRGLDVDRHTEVAR
jgi:RNA polymerase sigma-70 factor, ECF subfamily